VVERSKIKVTEVVRNAKIVFGAYLCEKYINLCKIKTTLTPFRSTRFVQYCVTVKMRSVRDNCTTVFERQHNSVPFSAYSLCAVNHGQLLCSAICKTLFSRQLWAAVCTQCSKPSNWSTTGQWNLHCHQQADCGTISAAQEYWAVLRRVLSTLLRHVCYFSTIDWHCCDFTVIVLPVTFGFTYLLTKDKCKPEVPRIVLLMCNTTACLFSVLRRCILASGRRY